MTPLNPSLVTPPLNDLEILRAEMTDDRFLARLEPAVAVAHE
jgi:hypothetical protein